MKTINYYSLIILLSFGIQLNAQQNDALSFNGTADYVQVINANSLNIVNNLTAEAWVQLDKVSGVNIVFSKSWCGNSQSGYTLSIADGKLRWTWNADGNCNFSSYIESNNIVFEGGECHHLAVVHTSTNVLLYVDGVSVPYTIMQGDYSNIMQSSEPLRIGIYRGLSGNFMFYMDGKIDELKFWDAARTPQQISYSMNNALVGNESNLVAYYDFDNLVSGSFITVPNKAIGTGSSLDAVSSSTSPLIVSSCAQLSSVNIEENAILTGNNKVNVYPNPTSSSLTIEFEKAVVNEIIQIVDVCGKKIKDINLSGIQKELDLSDLVKGIYYLKVGTSVSTSVKIIKE
jgi:hypothetical protein